MGLVRAVVVVLSGVICGGVWAQAPVNEAWERERTMTREERIAAHKAKIDEIIAAQRVVRANAIESTPGLLAMQAPQVHQPQTYESTIVAILTEMKLASAKIDALRGINEKLWELRVHAGNPTAPEVAAKVKGLLAGQQAVLSPAETEDFNKRYIEMTKQRQAEANKARAAQGQPPLGNPMASQPVMNMRRNADGSTTTFTTTAGPRAQ